MAKYAANKIAYSYGAQGGEYSGLTLAQLSPLEAGIYLLPAHATFTAPPADNGTNWPFWTGVAWELRVLEVEE